MPRNQTIRAGAARAGVRNELLDGDNARVENRVRDDGSVGHDNHNRESTNLRKGNNIRNDSNIGSRSNGNHARGGSRVEQRYLTRRLEILRAAGRAFRSRGLAETGMRDIAAAVDLSPANLYNYFKGKHELVFFCQDSALDRMQDALGKIRVKRVSAAEKLSLAIASHLRCVLDEVEGSAAHLFTADMPPKLQRRLVAKRDRYEEGVRQLIASGIRSGEFIPCDPALAARAILGALNWSVGWFSPEGKLTAAEIGEEFAFVLIRGLLAKPTAARSNGTSGRVVARGDYAG